MTRPAESSSPHRVLVKRIGDPYPPQAPALYFIDVEAAEAVGVSSVTVAPLASAL